MPPRQRPIQDMMENDKMVRLQQVVENLDDSVAAIQIQMQQGPREQTSSPCCNSFLWKGCGVVAVIESESCADGKRKIESWDKLKKHLCEAFLPYNYARVMYQRFQNLRQDARMVDEYTTKFYQLMARNDLGETDDQLVSRYIGGLQTQYQDTLNMFDLYFVSDAYQKALQLERQMKRHSSVLPWNGSSSRGVAQQETVRGGGAIGVMVGKPSYINSIKPMAGIAGRYFNPAGSEARKTRLNFRPGRAGPTHLTTLGEPGHRFADCKKPVVQKGLFIDNEGVVRVELVQPLEDFTDEQANEEVMGEEHVTLLRDPYTYGHFWERINVNHQKY
ncbi:hypothetical protein Acr_00g0008720 [Actinidia rufa]|uniref:Retrotransposon gag domain-containing protein n=1 Tax=Actinidia rufa TaxID=165716 RepID=A0A7J0DA60_9ERIC|nr:hypothetical protein Acr_00g0008720 [Actinidia rufa]